MRDEDKFRSVIHSVYVKKEADDTYRNEATHARANLTVNNEDSE